MKIFLTLSITCLLANLAGAALDIFPSVTHLDLKSSHEGRQIVVTSEGRDLTTTVQFHVEPAGIITVDSQGYVKPQANGRASLFVTDKATNETVDLPVTVSGMGKDAPIQFTHELIPLLTKYGCNGGGCHGKSGGQNGFQLSLLGYEPWNDYDYLVREGRGRRLTPAAPENSLVLLKASGELPHEGGARLTKGGDDYEIVKSWIVQGMPSSLEGEATVDHIEVFPKERVLKPGSQQQLAVTAFFSDGSSRDVTRLAIFESNQEDMSEASETGLVKLLDRTGTASIMVRFKEHVDVFRATIPLGEEMKGLPENKNFIDEEIFSKLSLLGLPPSGPSSDSTFLRRVTIDVAGRLPEGEEVKAFLEDKSPDKREKKIAALLESRDHADLFAQKWVGILRNKRDKAEYTRGTFAFHDWIRESIAENKPYDEFVTELVTASGEIGRNPAVAWYRSVKDQKEQMQDIAQVFMGIRMQCAQCHHHPYEKWSQDDYYSFTAFFSTIGRKAGEQPGEEIVYNRRIVPQMQNPNTKTMLKPTPLGADPLDLPAGSDPRDSLAEWMTSEENPYFAKMLVNRYWRHFYSRGLVEPEDDMRVTNPATHPVLLDRLAAHFIETGYDTRELIKTICSSKTYQLQSAPNDHNVTDTQNFSRYYPKRLPAEVLLDAINEVADAKETFTSQAPGVKAVQLPDDKFNSQSFFLSVFGRPENSSACECERVSDANLAQSLHLINSDTIQKKLTADSGTSARLALAKDRPDADRITELYIEALSRKPHDSEVQVAVSHLERKRQQATTAKPEEKVTPESAERQAFEDILWALLNTKEFLFNH